MEAGEQKLLITSDSDYTDPIFAAKFYQRHYDAVFVNSLPLSTKEGRRLLAGFNTERVIIYHLPFAEDDKYNYRAVAKQNLERHRDMLSNCQILNYRDEVLCL